MTTPKIHTSFDTETNQRLDELFQEWEIADNRAKQAAYNDDELNAEADTLSANYTDVLLSAKINA